MINKNIIKAVLVAATPKQKDIVLAELLNHISQNYDYNDDKAGHIIGMLMSSTEVVTIDKFNKDFADKNHKLLLYNEQKYNIINIKATNVDNIDCTIRVEFDYTEKINEDKDDLHYSHSYSNINFIDHPEILK